MTRREQQCLRFIERYMVENEGVSPTLAEIATELGLASRSNAHALIDSLVSSGMLSRSRWKPRSLELVGLPAALILTSDDALMAECRRRGLLDVAI